MSKRIFVKDENNGYNNSQEVLRVKAEDIEKGFKIQEEGFTFAVKPSEVENFNNYYEVSGKFIEDANEHILISTLDHDNNIPKWFFDLLIENRSSERTFEALIYDHNLYLDGKTRKLQLISFKKY